MISCFSLDNVDAQDKQERLPTEISDISDVDNCSDRFSNYAADEKIRKTAKNKFAD